MNVKGICGSGILDAVAELYKAGIINRTGAFNKKNKKFDRLRKNTSNNQLEFVLVWAAESAIAQDIVITQKDIRQVQLAKAAIYSGCKLMMKKIKIKHLATIKIASAFGTHVDPKSALIIGMLPDCKIDKIVPIGNAAGDGCRIALLNRNKRLEAEKISREVDHVELTLEKDFQKEFIDAISFPPFKDIPGSKTLQNK